MGVFKSLVGRTITEVRRCPEGRALCLTDSEGGTHYYQAEGDCCANAYVHEVDAPEFLLGKVTAVSEDDAPRQDAEYGDVLDVTFYRLSTARGTCTIELRVEHNGYYGGELACEECDPKMARDRCSTVLAVWAADMLGWESPSAVQVPVIAAAYGPIGDPEPMRAALAAVGYREAGNGE